MTASTQGDQPESPTIEREGNVLFRRFLAEAESQPRSEATPAPGVQGILFETVIDGVRYCLIRQQEARPAMPRVRLSPREREVARMIAEGYPNKVIASVLDISCWTVGTHLRRMFAKFNVTSRAALVARIAQAGLLQKPVPEG